MESIFMKSILFPGQGAQFRGMGKELFPVYPQLVKTASEILGYSIEKLCLENHENQLRLTQYTQPALYVVNALAYYKKCENEGTSGFHVDFLAGHSLGEYNALLAAEVFSFETGLQLVQKRGALMGAAKGGTMAAIVGLAAEEVQQLLKDYHLAGIDLANFNTPTQLVIAGPVNQILEVEKICTKKSTRCFVLNVSAPFHSRYMKEAQSEFSDFLCQFTFLQPKIPVIANATARPYENRKIAQTLSAQIASSVLWNESIRYLMGQGVIEYIEIGANILSKMVDEIKKTDTPLFIETPIVKTNQLKVENMAQPDAIKSRASMPFDKNVDARIHAEQCESTQSSRDAHAIGTPRITAESLGSSIFRERFGLRYAYMAGAMYRGIASAALVVRMGKAGFMGFFGTGGMSLKEIESRIQQIQGELSNGEPYGLNLLANYITPAVEMETVKLYLKYNVHVVEAAAFMQMTPALVLYRVKGLRKNTEDVVICENKILAKVSRPEVAEVFMSPPPAHVLQQLLNEGFITAEQVELARNIPMSHDICVEADSGGHTDGGIPSVLFPAMLQLKKEMSKKYTYKQPICMGLAGGIGTPEAAAAAFVMGADFILTGSINQCTVEAGISDEVKKLLQDINVQDTEYAPAGDMFEIGAKVQVLKKGVFFPARANKLYALYTHYNSLDEIPEKTRKQIEGNYFKKSFTDVWNETKSYLQKQGQLLDIEKAEAVPKHKMALVFRWYFSYTSKLSFAGTEDDRVNYQVHTGPALGAFNQWIKGTSLENWGNRHADEIGKKLLTETANYLNNSFERMACALTH
jgi:trans-AT polyketide synthase, acyltransferase and oxidoreductase domains